MGFKENYTVSINLLKSDIDEGRDDKWFPYNNRLKVKRQCVGEGKKKGG